jgi:regulator-associated protein of mTOR
MARIPGRPQVMAAGSRNQFIKVFDLKGEVTNLIRYHDGFLGTRIGPVSSLAFHPRLLLMAAGASDSVVSIYGSL